MVKDLKEYELGYVAGMRRAALIAAGWETGRQAAGDIRREANRYESIARDPELAAAALAVASSNAHGA